MRFEHDLLISYAHIDDQAFMEGGTGWVSRLHDILNVRVAQLLGMRPAIWRDPTLQGNDLFRDRIREELQKAAALLPVVSPSFLQSDFCHFELTEFCQAVEKSGVSVPNKKRIFKVVKTPVRDDQLPEEVRPMLGYEFFVRDRSGRPRELAQSETEPRFVAKLDDLAFDIVHLLEILRGGTQGKDDTPKGSVFLGETSFELHDQRESIKRDLIRNGYEVRPVRPAPLVAEKLDAFIREELLQCQLALHLIGRNYGVVPEGAVQSIVERQQVIATELGSKQLQNLIWLPPGLELEDDRQREFIARLRTDRLVHAAAELLEIEIEEFKSRIYRKLAPPAAAPISAAALEADVERVYLLCDQQDREATQPIEDFLFSRGLEVILPYFDEDEARTRLEHESNLKSCDAVLVYYGAGDELWLRAKLREVRKSPGFGRDKPWLARWIYVTPAPDKQRLRTLEATVVHEPASGFAEALLQPFVDEIARKRRPVS